MTRKTIELPDPLWTQVEAYVRQFGGTVVDDPDPLDIRCPVCGTALTPIPEAGWVCEECSE